MWEVLDSQPLSHMIEKISHCFLQSHGRIWIVILIQLIRQRPPSRPKRKRRPSAMGDESDTRRPSLSQVPTPAQDAHGVDENEPELPQPPPPGRLIQGFYWVYKHGLNAAGNHLAKCSIEHQVWSPSLVSLRILTFAGVLSYPASRCAHTYLG